LTKWVLCATLLASKIFHTKKSLDRKYRWYQWRIKLWTSNNKHWCS